MCINEILKDWRDEYIQKIQILQSFPTIIKHMQIKADIS